MLKRLTADHVLIVLFLLILTVPMLVSLAQPDQKISKVEKRQLAQWPALSRQQGLSAYFGGISDYVKDHFGFRGDLIHAHNKLKLRLGESPTDNTVMGKEGWLFYKTHDPLSSLTLNTGEVVRNLQARADSVLSLNSQLADQGIDYQMIIAPNKMSVYPEFLPNTYRMTDLTATFIKFKQLVDEGLREGQEDSVVFNLHHVIKTEKSRQSMDLYFKNDTHWNSYGAYKAANALIGHLHQRRPDLSFKLVQHQFDFKLKRGGDLANFIGLRKSLSNQEPETSFLRCARRKFLKKVKKGFVYSRCNTNGATLFMIGDSFMTYIYPYLAQSVGTMYMVNQGISQKELLKLIDEVKPDIVIDELVERNLSKALIK